MNSGGEEFKGSPYSRHRNEDLEASYPHRVYSDEDENCDPFDIFRTKSAPADRLKRWRQAALVLNASRRFRYTMDLKKEEKKQLVAKIRTHAHVIRLCFFKKLGKLCRVKGVAGKLKTDIEKGIVGNEGDLLKRSSEFGSNTYPQKKGRSFWRFLWEASGDTTLIILMVAAAASLALGIKTEICTSKIYIRHCCTSQAFSDLASSYCRSHAQHHAALVDMRFDEEEAVSDYKQSLQFQSLNDVKQNIQLEVIRGGRRIPISIFEIVVGDIVPLKIGDQVPADGLVLNGHSLGIDESSMTGESKIVHKDSKAPFLMSGCKVADGYGTMLVLSVGVHTEWGLLMASIAEDIGEETPLQVRLNGVATFIGMVGLGVAVAVLTVLMIRFFTGHTKDPHFEAGKTKAGDAIDGAIQIFTIAVTIVVVAVPEGLPLAVTLTLAYSMKKMMADKALVRRLSACETMGSATTICSDKTGTLTLNQMTVVDAYIGGKRMSPPDDKSQLPQKVISLLLEGIAHNTIGSVFVPEGGGAPEISGSPTEKAILQFGVDIGMNFAAIRSESTVIHAFPFNSEKKRGGVALKLNNSEARIHWKGAAEIVLSCCNSFIDANDNVVPLDENEELSIKKEIDDMAANSLRCVAIAYRPYDTDKFPKSEEELSGWVLPDRDLILLAVLGIKDPCRPGVGDAVQLCIDAGIKVTYFIIPIQFYQ
ncbi:unnamed protein product [Cuscuta campestris]|uniref:Calcium-transporting ATPase n=1 Tax=Cuscuta campestris TaxID=132261 RepID=A0A484LLM9_9ASTE|nr:unnamed protein product [Cuscuta campestris]